MTRDIESKLVRYDLVEALNLRKLIHWHYIPNYINSLDSNDEKALISSMKYEESSKHEADSNDDEKGSIRHLSK